MAKIAFEEKQNIEYKESWRDEYLKWICGFANAQGGRIYIGVDDDHEVVGISDSKRLMEDIPNKIVTTLGIVAEVNLHEADGLEYIEIVVSPSNVPIAFKGQYHYRSGHPVPMVEESGGGVLVTIQRKTIEDIIAGREESGTVKKENDGVNGVVSGAVNG
ncbi:MAG: ATP-binding protein, partial [Bacteroidales bacterium]|nr:ATP-binding protein [Bacteroidales bacterium]